MKKTTCIVLFTFQPDNIVNFLAQGEDPIRPFEISLRKTGHKSRERGDGVCITISTEKPNQILEFLKTGSAATIPYYKSICPNGHLLYSNARMFQNECPHGGCGTKIAEEYFYDVKTDEAWPAPHRVIEKGETS